MIVSAMARMRDGALCRQTALIQRTDVKLDASQSGSDWNAAFAQRVAQRYADTVAAAPRREPNGSGPGCMCTAARVLVQVACR
eukprot:942487-Pleurochrysis_carterae.AAC.2